MSQPTEEQVGTAIVVRDSAEEPACKHARLDTMESQVLLFKGDREMQLAYLNAISTIHGPCEYKYSRLETQLASEKEAWEKRTQKLRRWALAEEGKDEDDRYNSGCPLYFGGDGFVGMVDERIEKSLVLTYQDKHAYWQDEDVCSAGDMTHGFVRLSNAKLFRILCKSSKLLAKFTKWVDSKPDLDDLDEFMWGFIDAL